jgi:His-Xaa-Ser system protein HxsD
MNEFLQTAKPFMLTLDSSIYSLPAIMNASYEYSEKATIEVEKISEKQVRISLIPKSDGYSTLTLINNFKNLLIDHQVRIMTSQDYHTIREIIVAQAFQPCENIEDIIKLVKP